MAPTSLYVHIPFCRKICGYCDFPKLFYRSDWAEKYLTALEEEISSFSIPKGSLKTLYVGGGTPSALPLSLWTRLLSYLSIYIRKDAEWTVEANPESLDEEKIEAASSLGVNRVSLGVESSQRKFLDFMGRDASFEMAKEKIGLLRKHGIDNISIDLIYALPNETLKDLDQDLDAFLSLDLPHYSCYTLILEEGTSFYAKGVKEASEDVQGEQYEEVLRRMRKKGYDRYEVSSFCKDGKKSRHNLVYWHDEEYYGAGLGASGFVNRIRYTNTKSLSKYLSSSNKRMEEEPSDEEDFLLTNLRLEEGFALSEFERKFHHEFLSVYGEKTQKLIEEGLLTLKDGRLAPTDRGIECLDEVLVELF